MNDINDNINRHQKKHKRVDSGEKPYKCDYNGCDKSFKQKSHLTVHKRTHSGEKPFKCNKCKKGFTQSNNRNRHQKKCKFKQK